jgi:NAD(P)-dependent dehydrogenase (short-subunit alcohol dehydrogenase family)
VPNNRVAFVTGSAQGTGWAVAIAPAKDAHHVVSVEVAPLCATENST